MEEDLAKALSEVLLDKDVEGLEEELIEYMAGMLASKIMEDDHGAHGGDEEDDSDETLFQEAVDEVLVPFLESVNCPENLVQASTEAVLKVLRHQKQSDHNNGSSSSPAASSATATTTTRKLQQGVVSMASELTNQTDADIEASRYLWGSDRGVKPMANDIIDAQTEKASAKDKRKVRKADAEKMRKLLSSQNDRDIDDNDESGGLVKMNFFSDPLTGATPGSTDRGRDVQLRNVTVSLDNGTVLLEAGELKFTYQRRYGLIGENGVGKSTLLKAIANGLDGFPAHLRVLHVRQEVPAHLNLTMTVMQAVLESDVERTVLLKAEKDLLAKLDQAGTVAAAAAPEENSNSNKTLTLQEKRKKLADEAQQSDAANAAEWQAMAADLKRLDEVYARLQVLGSDSAEARAAMILSGLQFTPQMQTAPLSSLSGGYVYCTCHATLLLLLHHTTPPCPCSSLPFTSMS
jgi:energy-coupling factor transporter ATP-binding protein EcfA2